MMLQYEADQRRLAATVRIAVSVTAASETPLECESSAHALLLWFAEGF